VKVRKNFNPNRSLHPPEFLRIAPSEKCQRARNLRLPGSDHLRTEQAPRTRVARYANRNFAAAKTRIY